MTVAAYMSVDEWSHESFFDADRWGEIRYEGSAFHIPDHRQIQNLSVTGALCRRWNHWNGCGAAYFQSVGRVYMPFIRYREEETFQNRATTMIERLSLSPV